MSTKAKAKKKTNVKKLIMPKVEVLEDTEKPVEKKVIVKSAVQIKAEKEEDERVNPIPVNEVAEAIEISVVVIPLGTNHRQVRLAFDVRTNKVSASDISAIVQTVLTKAAPMIGNKLVEIIGVESNLLNATRQK